MAKQSGLHQIRGKVGEHSYYRQSGVKSGLIRRINQGLSQRVKTSEEYANTRLNNAEFGNAADVAKIIGVNIYPKFRPMIVNFSQSKMTKGLLALIKQATGQWGRRGLSATDAQSVCDVINSLAKYEFSNLVSILSDEAGASAGLTRLTFGVDDNNLANLASIGASSLRVNIRFVTVYAGQYQDEPAKYVKSLSIKADERFEEFEESSDPTATIDTSIVTPNYAGTEKITLAIVVAMPIRTIAGTEHILQQYCSFRAIPTVMRTE